MDMKLLRDAIEKRKGRRVIIDDMDEETKPKLEMTSEKQNENDDDGLAPDVKVKSQVKEEPKDEAQMEDIMALEAMEVLGRKPMSTVKETGYEDQEESSLDEDDLDQDVLEKMTDKRAIEQLKKGKNPAGLGDRVQMNIANMKKKIK